MSAQEKMTTQEKEIFNFINDMYGNAEFEDGFIYFSDEDSNRGYKVAVYETN